ncbi:alpha/beta hydrolase [Nodosilinea sp. P-1105]|uniref:serine aminopeptidase domain-containing protein n=1 Tax=Nodosilinea sp. P-1105 TaxID=2546229 RepID=UPI00146C4545|nr:alpha/beta hydrolase [Nodosilinea sp. P-1105]NMF86682.1 hypothetical protein [Nodosilinea sp. P-1105]
MSDRTAFSPIKFGSIIYLKNKNSNQYLISANAGTTKRYYWPYLSTNSKKKVALQLAPSSGKRVSFIQSVNWWLNPFQDRSKYYETIEFGNNDIISGSILKIKTSEPKVGDHDTLGIFRDSDNCYYWEEGYDDLRQGWLLTKVDGKDGEPICDGDEVYITNLAKNNQRLAVDDRNQGYITTKAEASDSWILERAPQRQIGEDEWFAYYNEFPYFSAEAVREGCYPRIMQQAKPTEKAIVLVHGLTDSPYFMTAIADHFFKLNYNVYIPLLQGHGLKIPSGMEGVSLREWQANVKFAVDAAAAEAKQISIGGLSTGGALSCYMAANHPKTAHKITGAIYLFSAALRIAGGMGSGNIKESLLRSFMANLLDSKGPLIGENPYRYGRMDNDGARVLSEQIKEIDELIKTLSPKSPFPKPVFAAHSEWDDAAAIQGIEALSLVSNLDQFRFFRIQREAAVGHAELVLAAPVKGASRTLEYPNPKFAEMMEAITEFDLAMTEKTNKAGKFQLQALRDRLQAQEDLKQEELQEANQEQTVKVDSIVEHHRQILADPQALIRYATIAQAVYYDPQSAAQQLKSLSCELIDESERVDTWFLDGLQAMCVRYSQGGTDELIVAYRGTEKTNPADLITDGGIGGMLASFSGDDIIRAVIRSEMAVDMQQSVAVSAAAKVTFVGQIAGRLVNAMKYYEEKACHLNFGQYQKITVVGHSLGGMIAAHVAYWANVKYAPDKIHCHTFNAAPGAKYTSMDAEGNIVYGKIYGDMDKDSQHNPPIANRIINHRIIGDIVSGLPLPIGTDEEGFPYAHLGYIYNWRPFEADSYTSIAVHFLERFIEDLKFETEHLVGIAPAPVGTIYW